MWFCQVKDKADVRLRLVAKPDKLAADLLAHMQLKLPTRPKRVQNVVETRSPSVTDFSRKSEILVP